jgi:hypothetical protein
MKKPLKIFLLFLFCISLLIGVITIIINQTFKHIDNVCVYSSGPCYGSKINISLDSIITDKIINLENGRLHFTNTKDSISPSIIYTGLDNEIIWAIKLISQTEGCELPIYQMSNIEIDSEDKFTISFFNESYQEPGRIHLTKDYEFEAMCLNPM